MADVVLGSFAVSVCRLWVALTALGAVTACVGEGAVPKDIPPRPAEQLFVATLDGTVHVVALDADGDPGATIATARVDDRLQFLAFHPSEPVVYALGDRSLHAIAWRSDPPSLEVLGAAEVGLRGTHLAIDQTARYAFVASYGDHAVTMLELGEDGVPSGPVATLGGGDDPTFRNAHQVRVHPNNRAVHVPCLGADHVTTLAFDAGHGALRLLGTATTHDGAGPRHMDYHPTRRFAWVLNELASSVTLFRVDPGAGLLTPIDTVSTMPDGSEGASRSSDIHVTPDGRYLLAVNREPLDDVVSFAIDGEGGLAEVGRVATGGRHARTFAVDPTGFRLWIGNTRSKEITTVAISDDGGLVLRDGRWRAEGEVYCVLVGPGREWE